MKWTGYLWHSFLLTQKPRTGHFPALHSSLTDWVVENLEEDDEKITSRSENRAGENDLIPDDLCIAGFHIKASGKDITADESDTGTIRLLLGRNGWGTGVHPTTRLCLEIISDDRYLQPGDMLVDYGCGSGILSIAALLKGAKNCIGVDIEAEALVTAERNIELNGYDSGRFEGLHTREVLPYGIRPTADMIVANILVGQLVRPSMVAALLSNLKSGGYLCLSGIRPNEVQSLKDAYGESIQWLEERTLKALDTQGSIESYGFDCGEWAAIVGRKVGDDEGMIQRMSELAVS